MGQRLNLEIVVGENVIANAYYHWSGLTSTSLLVSKRVNNNYNMEHQRDYDFDDIEKRLMEKQLGY